MSTEDIFRARRRRSFAIALSYIFLGACEQAMTFSTIRLYLQTMGVKSSSCLGFFTIYASIIINAFMGLVGGEMTDKYPTHTKIMIISGIFFNMVGNLQYTLGLSIWNLLCARVVIGFSGIASVGILAEYGRVTTRLERTMYLSLTNAAFAFGILLTPAFDFGLLPLLNFHFLGFSVNFLNSPGFIMAILWWVQLVITVFFYSNLTEEFKDFDIKRIYETRFPLEIMKDPTKDDCEEECPHEKDALCEKYKAEILTNSFVLLMAMVFVICFCEVTLEVGLVVYAKKYFGFSMMENTTVTSLVSLEAFVVYLVVSFLGKYVRETTLQISGLFMMVMALIWLSIVMPQFEKGNDTHMIYFLVGIFVNMLGIPLGSVANLILSSKLLSSDTQGLGQGIRRFSCILAFILSPHWTGQTMDKPHLFFGLLLILIILNGIMLLACYTHLRNAEENNPLDYPDVPAIVVSSETDPLLENQKSP